MVKHGRFSMMRKESNPHSKIVFVHMCLVMQEVVVAKEWAASVGELASLTISVDVLYVYYTMYDELM